MSDDISIRVRVHSGDGTAYLGEGTYVGEVTVYFYRGQTDDGDDQLLSVAGNAEVRPSDDDIPEGYELVEDTNNPKIVLDSGEVIYGCQCWWDLIDPAYWPAIYKRLNHEPDQG